MDFTTIDFETAQGSRCSICQVGIVRIENDKIIHTYSRLVKPPENKYSIWNTGIHGIHSFMTEKSPIFPEIWGNIKNLFENQLVVAHNINFDIDCLKQTLKYYCIEIPNFEMDCTFLKTGISLEQLCQAFEISLDKHHDALQDALACAQIYIHLSKNEIPDYSKIKQTTKTNKTAFNFPGHERIKGELLKPNLKNANSESIFYGKKVVFTGVLSSIQREDAAKIIRDLGADIDSNITPKTNYVIVGADPGPVKMKKVEKYNNEGSSIRILKEDEFLTVIKKLA